MKILIAGGGQTASLVAARLIREGNEVVLVEKDAERCRKLEESLDARIVQGNAASIGTLRRAGIADAEMLIALSQACLVFDLEKYWPAYENVHRFVFDKMIHHQVGEWWPLLTREGKPIWTHMSHNWKINYHTVRSMIETIKRLDLLYEKMK